MFDLIQLLVNIKKEYSLEHFNREIEERERDTHKRVGHDKLFLAPAR